MKAEKKFIIESIRAYLGSSSKSKVNLLFKSVNTSRLKKLIHLYDIAGLFYQMHLKKVFDEVNLGTEILDYLKKISGRNSLINTVYESEILKLIQHFNNNIDYFYIKGFSTQKKCFDADHIRRSNDIDFFIKKKDYEKVKGILLSVGYKIPIDHYKIAKDQISVSQYEKTEGEICFLKKEGPIEYIVDLQWDIINHDKTHIFHRLYNINNFYNFDNVDKIFINNKEINILPLELEFINMSFHFAFHHGFIGIKWLIEICIFLKKYEEKIDFDYILKTADDNLKKIIGITLMLAYDFNYKKELTRQQKKLFCVNKLLFFEYLFYKNLTMKVLEAKSIGRTMRLVKILLPYSKFSSFRIINAKIKYILKNLFFNNNNF